MTEFLVGHSWQDVLLLLSEGVAMVPHVCLYGAWGIRVDSTRLIPSNDAKSTWRLMFNTRDKVLCTECMSYRFDVYMICSGIDSTLWREVLCFPFLPHRNSVYFVISRV